MTLDVAPLRGRFAAGALSAICAIAAVTAPAATAATKRVRIGSVPALPAGTTPVASAASVKSMRVTVALRPRDPGALNSFARAVSNDHSPDYHQYLTPAQFRRRFAPTTATIRRVEASLRANGLKPSGVAANGLAIYLRSSSAAIEHGFSLTLARVRTAAGTDVLYNVQAPAVNASVAGAVQAVIGLDGFAHETTNLIRRASVKTNPIIAAAQRAQTGGGDRSHVVTGGPQPCTAASSAPTDDPNAAEGAYTADQIASAYDFSGLYGAGDRGAGSTIALYELEPNLASDIAAYQKCYGTDASVSYVKVDGGAQSDPEEGGPAGSGEAALDIEQLIGLAPKAKILVYQGPNSDFDLPGAGPYDVMAKIISQDQAEVISSSWGDCEADEGSFSAAAENTLFEEAAAQGQTVVAAAGDSGSEDCYDPDDGGYLNGYSTALAVDDPGSQPFVTAAGGTTMDSFAQPQDQSVWNDGDSGGAGAGGLSQIWSMPSYQTSAAGDLDVIQADSSKEGCGPSASVPSYPYCREVPDVSADADEYTGYLIYYDGTGISPGIRGWQAIGGTSAAAPLWASLFALADSDSVCKARIGFANGSLYQLAGESLSTYFTDIKTGNNDMTGNNHGLFPALTGYDMASGLGTPIASALAPALCGETVNVTTPSPRHTFVGTAVSLQLHAKAASGVTGALTYGARSLPAGVTLDTTTGKISGTPTTPGVKTVIVDAHTGAGIYGGTRFTWTVEARPQVSGTSLKGVGSGQPQLALTVAAGADEPALREIQVRLPAGLAPTGSLAKLRVLGRHTRALKHHATRRGDVVTVRVTTAEAKLKLVFGSGTLRPSQAIRNDAKRALPKALPFALTVIDTAGGTSKLSASVRPSA